MLKQLTIAAIICGPTLIISGSALGDGCDYDYIACDDEECETCDWVTVPAGDTYFDVFFNCHVNEKLVVELTCGVDLSEVGPRLTAPQTPQVLELRRPDLRVIPLQLPQASVRLPQSHSR